MITLFVALYSLLCLCTTVKTSNVKELHVKTVKHGEFVTMECNISRDRHRNNVFWYKQSFGELPQFLVRPYSNNLGYTFVDGFNDNRFSVTVKDQKFDLNINEIREDDGGEYFCGYVEGVTVKFTSGTRLQFEGKTSNIKNLHAKTVKRGEAVTMECNISEVRSKYAIAWYRQSFGKVPQFLVRPYSRTLGYTFVEGFTDSRFSVTVKDQKFDLNINEIREDDGGEYFCGYVEGSTVKFTSGTRLQFEGEEMKPCPTPGTLNKNTHSVTHQGSNSSDGEGKKIDIRDLQAKTVKSGEAVTMECNISEVKNSFAWYRQSFGKVPQILARQYGGTLGYTFVDGFNDNRFSVTVNDQKFDLNINEIREDDGGEYFCGYVDGWRLKFPSGTRLQFEGEEMKPCPTPGTLNKNTHSVTHQGSNSRDGEGQTSDIKDFYIKTVKPGESVTMECNNTEVKNKNTLAWYRQSFEELPQFLVRPYPGTLGYTFAEGFNDRRFSVTVKEQKFDLNINEMIDDDKGKYFCGYVEGAILKFTSGTRLQFEGASSNNHQTPTNQPDDV